MAAVRRWTALNSLLPLLLEAKIRCAHQLGEELELAVDSVVDIQTVVVVAVEGASATPHQTPLKVRLESFHKQPVQASATEIGEMIHECEGELVLTLTNKKVRQDVIPRELFYLTSL